MKDEMRIFLSKILTAQSITKEIREEALLLRDTLDILKKNVGVVHLNSTDVFTYPGVINGTSNKELSFVHVQKCVRDALCDRHPTYPSKISFIKSLRQHHGCGLKEAKELAEWLYEKGHALYQ